MRTRPLALWMTLTCLLSLFVVSKNAIAETKSDYLQTVKSYADTMVEKGRDHYGKEHSPLFATTLDRKNHEIFDEAGFERLWQIRLQDWENWRIRNRDRMTPGANPMHDQDLCQILYALTEITGDKRYAQEADKTLKWFLKHCQSPTTGLMAWGEHMGWDFRTEDLIKWRKGSHHGGKMQEYNTHEFGNAWVHWDRCFDLAPEACTKFAEGLWHHQIGDHNTGNFSRHANYEMHQTYKNSEYPRHGGYFIATWAYAFKYTEDPLFVKAIDTLVGYFDSRRSTQSDAFPAESAERSGGKTYWTSSNLMYAICTWNGANYMPDELAWKMRQSSLRTDRVVLKMEHNLRPGGKGFIGNAHVDTLEANKGGRTEGWGHAGMANLCFVRYSQVKLEGYKKLVLDTAKLYLGDEPPIEHALHPSQVGGVIYLMTAAYKLTGESKYLVRGDYYVKRAIELFFDDASALPKATSKHEHYEAVTGADGLMLAMLKLWAAKERPGLRLSLEYSDR